MFAAAVLVVLVRTRVRHGNRRHRPNVPRRRLSVGLVAVIGPLLERPRLRWRPGAGVLLGGVLPSCCWASSRPARVGSSIVAGSVRIRSVSAALLIQQFAFGGFTGLLLTLTYDAERLAIACTPPGHHRVPLGALPTALLSPDSPCASVGPPLPRRAYCLPSHLALLTGRGTPPHTQRLVTAAWPCYSSLGSLIMPH